MKTYRLLLAAGLFAGATSLLTAGPGPEYWMRASPARITKPTAPAVTTAAAPIPTVTPAPACSACACCQKAT